MRHAAHLPADARRMIDQVAQSALHMTSLVNDLLALSVVAHTEVRLSQVDLAALAREIVDELRRNEPARRVDFEAPDTLPVRCDPGLARSLMCNVLGNAWKFSGKRPVGRIRLSADVAHEGTVVRVEDNGAGFDAGPGANLFKPFQRFHTAAEFHGTGVGLATCARIVERHGGRIWIESTPDRGTTLSFLLPASAAADPAARTETAPG
jgi:signal transduction histidine kinase